MLWGALIVVLVVGMPVGYGVYYTRIRDRTSHVAQMWLIDTCVNEFYALGFACVFIAQLDLDSKWRLTGSFLGLFVLILAPVIWVLAQRRKRRLQAR